MIAKERKVPLRALKLEALLRRIPKSHSKRAEIEGDLGKILAGFRGEQSIDYYLSFLPDSKFTIFHDLRIKGAQYYFQLDTLILSRNFALIIEIKNISGTLFFDQSFNQLIRSLNDKEEGFSDPVTQVKRQMLQLHSWLKTQKITPFPLEYLVAISNSSTILKTDTNSSYFHQKVCHSSQLIDKINELENQHKEPMLSTKDMRKLTRLLLNSHTPQSKEILTKYNLNKEDLLTGVQCPNCLFIPMVREHGSWLCPNCLVKSKNAFEQAIQDYVHLFENTITNLQFRKFLHIPSRHAATRLLHSLNLSYHGSNKGRVYFLPLN